MEAQTVWDVLKTIISWLWIPLGVYMTYKNNHDNRNEQWKENIEQRISLAEANDKLLDLHVKTIKESLASVAKETKEAIREVKQGVDKLIDKLIK